MKYTPRRIAAWLEVMDRIDMYDSASRISEGRAAGGEAKAVNAFLRKLREQL